MRLHLTDEVTKRRLVQVMEQILVAENPPPPITETQIEAARLAREDELRRPKWYSIAHLYFTPDRESEIESVMTRVALESLDAEGARHLGSPFLLGYEFWQQTPHQLAGLFGTSFPEQLEKIDLSIGRWHGPIASSYGYHYIWLHEFQAARPARFEEVERQLRQELFGKARSLALQRGKESLRAEYEVRI
jgi:hypothetical protein